MRGRRVIEDHTADNGERARHSRGGPFVGDRLPAVPATACARCSRTAEDEPEQPYDQHDHGDPPQRLAGAPRTEEDEGEQQNQYHRNHLLLPPGPRVPAVYRFMQRTQKLFLARADRRRPARETFVNVIAGSQDRAQQRPGEGRQGLMDDGLNYSVDARIRVALSAKAAQAGTAGASLVPTHGEYGSPPGELAELAGYLAHTANEAMTFAVACERERGTSWDRIAEVLDEDTDVIRRQYEEPVAGLRRRLLIL